MQETRDQRLVRLPFGERALLDGFGLRVGRCVRKSRSEAPASGLVSPDDVRPDALPLAQVEQIQFGATGIRAANE